MITEFVFLKFQQIICCTCSVRFYTPVELYERRKETGNTFWCPNGHEQHFTETTKKKLERAELELSQVKASRDRERDQRLAAEAATLRLKRRVSKGVCPCCKRTVSQLAKHMETKHPEFPDRPGVRFASNARAMDAAERTLQQYRSVFQKLAHDKDKSS